MSLFSQLFNRKPTGHAQVPVEAMYVELQEQIRLNTRRVAQLSDDFDELVEKTSRKLKRYAAWAQPRKDGKFGPQETGDGANGSNLIQGYGAVPTPTHDQIERMARERDLLK